MHRTMGMLNLHEKVFPMGELTSVRPLSAIPFGGKYRMVDFALSNMVNSGIHTVGALIPENSSSLLQHIRAGKEWDLDRKRGGLFVLSPLAHEGQMIGSGDVNYFFQHIDFLIESPQYEYVVLSSSHIVCNIDYSAVLKYHQNSGADITLVYYKPLECNLKSQKDIMLTLDDQEWVTEIEIDSIASHSSNRFMWTWIIKRELLIELINGSYSRGGGDLIRELQEAVKRCKINAYEFTGYVANVVDVLSYYRCTMDLLKEDIWNHLFFSNGHIYTKVRDSQPTKYLKNAQIRNSLLANNCKIDGTVWNSVLFRSVEVSEESMIKDSIVMTDSYIGKNVYLENVICDKDVYISDNHVLKGDKGYPLVIRKGTVI